MKPSWTILTVLAVVLSASLFTQAAASPPSVSILHACPPPDPNRHGYPCKNHPGLITQAIWGNSNSDSILGWLVG